jgi:hypothetical protein
VRDKDYLPLNTTCLVQDESCLVRDKSYLVRVFPGNGQVNGACKQLNKI